MNFRMAAVLMVGIILLSCSENNPTASSQVGHKGRTRWYYVAAEDTAWNYMPDGFDSIFDRPPPTPWGDSLVYPKARYVEYTDSTFTSRVPQPTWIGILGPMLRGVVGDTLKVMFLNRTDKPLSMHPHGLTYTPENEGALYDPPRGGGDSVTAGGRYTYTWIAEPQSGPRKGEPSSKVWLYHSHVMAEEEMYRGLVGTIVVTDPKHANADATPEDVDREFVTFWMVFNENTPTSDPEDEEMNLKHAINGYFFGNLHGFEMNQGDRVRWYLVALGTEVDLHTPHWHGEKIALEGRTYTDVVELLPASMKVGDMIADNPGRWLLHCHVNDHMTAGMFTLFTIQGATPLADLRPTLTPASGWFGFHDIGLDHPIGGMHGQ